MGQSRSRRQIQMCVTQFGEWPNLNKTPNSLTFFLVAFKSQTKMFNVVKLEANNEWSRFSLSLHYCCSVRLASKTITTRDNTVWHKTFLTVLTRSTSVAIYYFSILFVCSISRSIFKTIIHTKIFIYSIRLLSWLF